MFKSEIIRLPWLQASMLLNCYTLYIYNCNSGCAASVENSWISSLFSQIHQSVIHHPKKTSPMFFGQERGIGKVCRCHGLPESFGEVTGDWCVFGKGELWPPRWCEHSSNRGSLVAIIEYMIYVIPGLKASFSPLTTSILLGGWRQTLICRDIDGYPYSKRSLKTLITADVVLRFFCLEFPIGSI